MTEVNIKLPDSLAKKAEELARQDGITIDQFISLAVSEKLSGWILEGYIGERAKRASRAHFEEALKQVPNVEPEEYDRL